MIEHDLSICQPDYEGRGLANLMASLRGALTSTESLYPALQDFPTGSIKAAERVVLLVIDGLGEELLRHIGAGSALAAHRESCMTSVYPPTTATAVTSLLTGQAPAQHGLNGWFVQLHGINTTAAVLPFTERASGKPLSADGHRIEELVGCESFFADVDGPTALLQLAAIVDSEFSRMAGGPATRMGYTSLEEFAAKLLHFVQGGTNARYLYAYYSDVDLLSHIHGPSSTQVAEHFRQLDAALRPVLETCRQSGTLLVASADHGFLDSGEDERVNLEDHPELAAMLRLPLSGEPRSACCFLREACESAFVDYVASEMSEYAIAVPSQQLLDEAWYGVSPFHPELAGRIGDYTLQMKGRYTIRDLMPGERNVRMKGMHGGITRAEQMVPLILAGP